MMRMPGLGGHRGPVGRLRGWGERLGWVPCCLFWFVGCYGHACRADSLKCCAHGFAFVLSSNPTVPSSHPCSSCFPTYNAAATQLCTI